MEGGNGEITMLNDIASYKEESLEPSKAFHGEKGVCLEKSREWNLARIWHDMAYLNFVHPLIS